jgi:hypothetical protein
MPIRCDNPQRHFHTAPLVLNGEPFKPILDHNNDNNSDNRPENLQLLCPNCDAQLSTRGGGNKGRIKKAYGGAFLWPTCGIRVTLTAGICWRTNMATPTQVLLSIE